jgi:hypothetical protein
MPWRQYFCAFCLFLLTIAVPSPGQAPSGLDGEWKNVDPNHARFDRVVISGTQVRPYRGALGGELTAFTRDEFGALRGSIDLSHLHSHDTLVITQDGTGRIVMHDHRHYTDGDFTHRDSDHDDVFIRVPAAGEAHESSTESVPVPPPPPAVAKALPEGPTMEQTIAFINGAFMEEGPITYRLYADNKKSTSGPYQATVSADNSCVLRIADPKNGERRVSLAHVDPRTVQVRPMETYFSEAFGSTIPEGSTGVADLVIVTMRATAEVGPRYEDRNPDGGRFRDKLLAMRVAKAYIHAIVLCHPNEAPSPF